MTVVTSLEVYNTVYHITPTNNTFKILLNEQKLNSIGVDTQLVKNVKDLFMPICRIAFFQLILKTVILPNLCTSQYSNQKFAQLLISNFNSKKNVLYFFLQNSYF